MLVQFCKNWGQRFTNDERGTTAVIFGLMAVPLFAMAGMALDYARANNEMDQMQSALDAGVLAAANVDNADKIETAQAFFNANFDASIAPATTAFELDEAGNITGTASAVVPMPFASLAKLRSADVNIDASATTDANSTTSSVVTTSTTTPGNVPCIHVMDQSGADTFWLDSNSNMNASTCVVNVRSNNSQAMLDISSSNVKFKKILVKGGALVSSGLAVVDAPYTVQTNQAVVGDPYSAAVDSVVKNITVGGCTNGNTGKTWTGNVSPGTYCGSTTFNNAKFAPGLYIIASDNGHAKNGGLKISGNTDGSAGVSFYFADNKSQLVSYTASEGSKLSAPVNGLTRGLLFFENSNRGANYPLSLKSVNKQSWTGLIYLPSANMTLDSLSEWPYFNVSIAANQLKMISLSSVMLPYSWTPFNQSQAVLLPSTTVTTSRNVQTTTHTDGYLND